MYQVLEKKVEKRMNMARKTVTLLPSTERALEKVGANIKKARLRRNTRAELLAERAGISVDTLSSIEKGVSTVSIGAYAAVLFSLGMEKDLELLGACLLYTSPSPLDRTRSRMPSSA